MTDSRHLENRPIAEWVSQAYRPSAILDFKNETLIGGALKHAFCSTVPSPSNLSLITALVCDIAHFLTVMFHKVVYRRV